jgi:RNA polymerase sigma-70 factor (ECF subfamily)
MALERLSEDVAELLRVVYPRVLAKTVTFTRNLPDAEDAAQDAVLRALHAWPRQGLPDSPEAWLVVVARNAHRDRVRRRAREELTGEPLEALAAMSPWTRGTATHPEMASGWKDDLLRLLFACCHPALDPGESAALALATILGLSTKEIAAAFVTAPRTIEQRLARARRRLRREGGAEGAPASDALARLDGVLRALALLFNEGYWSTQADTPIRADLCGLAVGLGRSLLEAFPAEPEVAGLVALFMLHDARRGARINESGAPVPLPEQDRKRWDREAIDRACSLLARASFVGKPGPFQLEAAISAVHSVAPSAEMTDWSAIADLYEKLEHHRPAAAVRVNRAFAVARAKGPLAGLALLDCDPPRGTLDYPYVHLVRGALLAELGREAEARTALSTARDHARNAAERSQIEKRLAQLMIHSGQPECIAPR